MPDSAQSSGIIERMVLTLACVEICVELGLQHVMVGTPKRVSIEPDRQRGDVSRAWVKNRSQQRKVIIWRVGDEAHRTEGTDPVAETMPKLGYRFDAIAVLQQWNDVLLRSR